MAKQVYKIDQFHGGVNNNADPRDIKDHEFVELRDIVVNNIGQIKTMGRGELLNYVFETDSLTNSYGYGLFAFSHDYTMAGHHSLLRNGITNQNSGSIWTATTNGLYGWTKNNGNFTYAAQGDVGVIYQTANNRQDRGFNSTNYKLTYTVAGYSESGGTPVFKIKGGSGEFANTDQNLTRANGTYTKTFLSHSSARTGKFSIQASGSTMNIVLSNLKLEPIAVNTGDNYLFNYRGPGANNVFEDVIFTYSFNQGTYAVQEKPSSDTLNFSFPREQGATIYPQYNLIDGNIRLSDRKKGEYNILKWYGYIERNRWGTTSVKCNKWIYTDAELLSPTDTNIVLSGSGSSYSPDEGKLEISTDYGFSNMVAESGKWNPNGVVGTSASSGNALRKLISNSAVFSSNMVGMSVKMGSSVSIITGFESETIVHTESITWSDSTAFQVYDSYDLGFTWVYDGNQESLIHNRTSIAEPTKKNFSFFIQDIAAGHAWDTSFTGRITGANMYYRKNSDTSKTWYHLLEIDLNKGLRKSDQEDFTTTWTQITSTTEYHLQDTFISEPPTFETYETRNGFKNDPTELFNMNNDDQVGVGYSTGVFANRQFYIGNIKMANKDGIYKNHGDMMLKSLPNKFDLFPLNRKVEVSVQDGDEIVHLDTYADRLLQYKKNKLHIINISQEIEFLEDTYMYKGVKNPYAVCRTDYGIAWVNDLGCYLYDGKEVRNLLEHEGFSRFDVHIRDLDSSNGWFNYDNDNPSIGYLPNKRQLIIMADPKGEQHDNSIYLYDMTTKSWTYGLNKIDTDEESGDSLPVSNFVNDYKGRLVWSAGTESSELMYWTDTPTASITAIIKTKDIDFNAPAVRKRIYKVRISYKGDADTLTFQYSVNGDNNTFYNFEGTSLGKPTGSANTTPLEDTKADDTYWYHAELKPATTSQANNIYSFQLHMSGTVLSSFAINDISIIYRIKTVK